jgi:predicted nucleic acid-binding protein
MSLDCVVDASVAIKLFLVEPLSDRADALLDHLTVAHPPRFYVPDLLFVECANILWKYVRLFRYPQDAAQQDIADLVSLPFQVIPTAGLVAEALAVAVTHGITAYDAVYVALSRRFSLPLVTADETLARRLAKSEFDVRFLADWPPTATAGGCAS